METLEAKHAGYLRMAATIFKVGSVIYAITLLCGGSLATSVQPLALLIFFIDFARSLFLAFIIFSIGKAFDFLADLAVVADDTWKRVEDARRTARRQEERQS